MPTVISRDSTQIAYEASGSGPPLLLVHGGGSTPERWRPILPRFESDFTVYRLARRGIGASGAASDYSVERQGEDIAAVVDAIVDASVDASGGPVALLGHSFGGLCALEGARLTANLRRLILYEPPIVPLLPPGFVDRLERLLDANDRDGVWATMNREIVKMPEDEIALQRLQPAHAARLAGIHVLVYEARALERYDFDPARYAALTVPLLLLVGGNSPAWAQAATRRLHQAVSSSCVVAMPGQQHIAMDTAPDLFVQAVIAFLNAS